jgi:hypothetical protein
MSISICIEVAIYMNDRFVVCEQEVLRAKKKLYVKKRAAPRDRPFYIDFRNCYSAAIFGELASMVSLLLRLVANLTSAGS